MSAALPIAQVVSQLGLHPDDVEPYGWYKGKLALGLERRLLDRPAGRYIGVTAINPTPWGEGKTVTAIGLAMALHREGQRAIATLRQPSQGPVFGIKGGGAGGGRAVLFPADDINLHFTGDLHAITAANNLLAAVLDNHVQRALAPVIVPESIAWRRVIDMNDKGLAHITTGVDHVRQAPQRDTGFDLTAASEVMAIVALADGLSDLKRRIGRIVVGESPAGDPVSADDLGITGAMTALLRDAVRPNLVQTCEQTPAMVHAGPFANIAHGNSSILADQAALRLADFVVTESGFGADCGGEKFFNIKCRQSGLWPHAQVLVCTVRSLKYQSGRYVVKPGRPMPPELVREDLAALEAGAVNLEAHLALLRKFDVPVVVAVNRFPTDTEKELSRISQRAVEFGASGVALTDAFSQGGTGSRALAEAVEAVCQAPKPHRFTYPLEMPLADKLNEVVRQVYGGEGTILEPQARHRLQKYQDWGFGTLPICIAKTQYSLSHDPARLGRPAGFQVPIRDVRLAAGAGYVYAIAGDISTLPGLPREPAALKIDVAPDGSITGLT